MMSKIQEDEDHDDDYDVFLRLIVEQTPCVGALKLWELLQS